MITTHDNQEEIRLLWNKLHVNFVLYFHIAWEKMLKHSCLIFTDSLRTQKQITKAKTMSLQSLQRVENWLQCLFLDITHQIRILLFFAYWKPVNRIFAVPIHVTGFSWAESTSLRAGLGSPWPELGWFQLCLGAKCLVPPLLSLNCASASMEGSGKSFGSCLRNRSPWEGWAEGGGSGAKVTLCWEQPEAAAWEGHWHEEDQAPRLWRKDINQHQHRNPPSKEKCPGVSLCDPSHPCLPA